MPWWLPITWPDIPAACRNTCGWKSDTIQGFLPGKFKYTITIPPDWEGIPAIIAKPEDMNARIVVKRATKLDGSITDRTITFTCIAEDNVTIQVYELILEKGKDPNNIQDWKGEPFISQYCFRQDNSNDFLEIVNPGTALLDLSHYMLTFSAVTDPSQAISLNSVNTDSSGPTQM